MTSENKYQILLHYKVCKKDNLNCHYTIHVATFISQIHVVFDRQCVIAVAKCSITKVRPSKPKKSQGNYKSNAIYLRL